MSYNENSQARSANGFGSFRYDIFLWDDLDAENIRNGDELPICHLNRAADCVDPLDLMSIMPELL